MLCGLLGGVFWFFVGWVCWVFCLFFFFPSKCYRFDSFIKGKKNCNFNILVHAYFLKVLLLTILFTDVNPTGGFHNGVTSSYDTVCILNNAATTLVTWLHLFIWLYSSCIDSGRFLVCSDSSQFFSPVYRCCIWSLHFLLTPLFSLTLTPAVELKDVATLCAAQVPCYTNQRTWGAVIKLQTDISTDCTIFVRAILTADA